MYITYADTAAHNPPFEVFNGNQEAPQEVPARVERIMEALKRHKYEVNLNTATVPLEHLKQVHDPAYIEFLERACNELTGAYQFPSVFQLRSFAKSTGNKLGQLGYFSFDMYTPLVAATYQAALQSASLSWALSEKIVNKEVTAGYALCRPPGHHAEYNQMGGYCYFNNSAVAAENLSHHGKVAILDVDFHHGNGTQNIFLNREDVLTVSLHADTNWKFPFFSGDADVVGCGTNLNLPLQQGTDNDTFQAALEKGLERIETFKPDFLVIGLGLDTHKDDPIGGFTLTTEYYTKMAATIAQLQLPVLINQEGGYNTELLGENVVAFLKGWVDV